MELIRRLLLVASAFVLATAGPTTPSGDCWSEMDFTACFVKQTYAKVQPKLTSLQEKITKLEQSLKNRKEFRCESGDIGTASWPTMPKWPFTKNVQFKTPFEKAPTVTYGLSYIDIDVSSQDRVKAEAANITNAGFQLSVTTWQYSKLWGARATWIACGI